MPASSRFCLRESRTRQVAGADIVHAAASDCVPMPETRSSSSSTCRELARPRSTTSPRPPDASAPRHGSRRGPPTLPSNAAPTGRLDVGRTGARCTPRCRRTVPRRERLPYYLRVLVRHGPSISVSHAARVMARSSPRRATSRSPPGPRHRRSPGPPPGRATRGRTRHSPRVRSGPPRPGRRRAGSGCPRPWWPAIRAGARADLRHAEQRHPDQARGGQRHAEPADVGALPGDQADARPPRRRTARAGRTGSRPASARAARPRREWMLAPVKRQTMMAEANPSIAESMPNPTSAIDPATTPAMIAILPSAYIHTRLSHDSCFTRRTARHVVGGLVGPPALARSPRHSARTDVQQRPAGRGQRERDDLAVASRVDQAGLPQHLQMVRDERLRAPGDPGDVTPAELVGPARAPTRCSAASGPTAPGRPLPPARPRPARAAGPGSPRPSAGRDRAGRRSRPWPRHSNARWIDLARAPPARARHRRHRLRDRGRGEQDGGAERDQGQALEHRVGLEMPSSSGSNGAHDRSREQVRAVA